MSLESIAPEFVAGAGGAAAKTIVDRLGPNPVPWQRSVATFGIGFLVSTFAGPAIADVLGMHTDHLRCGTAFCVGAVGQTLLGKFMDAVTRLSPDSVFARAFGLPPSTTTDGRKE